MTSWPPFSSDAFLRALADAYFPGAEPRLVECDGRVFRTLVTRRGNPVSGFYPFPFYLEEVRPEGAERPLRVPYLAEVAVATTLAGEPGPRGTVASPFVDLRQFNSWEEVVASATPPPGVNSPKRTEEKMRHMLRDLGPVEVTVDDRDPVTFETLLRWKSAQYSRTWKSHRMSVAKNLAFYRDLHARGLFSVYSVRAGGRLISGKIGLRSGGRSLWRVTVYDPEFARYSPGAVVEMLSLKACFEAGDEEFDYLMGDETYKFCFATHVRWIGNIGREPKADRLRRHARMRVARVVTRSPALYRGLKQAEDGVRRVGRRLSRA